jgi:mannose-1-phosphate guanylyltransferase
LWHGFCFVVDVPRPKPSVLLFAVDSARAGTEFPMATDVWTVVLAAGAGRRLSSVTGGVPKQFWRGAHGRSLLEQTMDRFAPLTSRSRTVVVVDVTHHPHVSAAGAPSSIGTLIHQPQDRGTAAGVLLALQPVLEAEPEAIVALTPADHGVSDGAQFRRGVLEAARHARSNDDIVLFGVEPTAAQDDYGWITPGPSQATGPLRAISSFVEKPHPDRAASLLAEGAVWNTMVLVGRARALRDLYLELVPDLTGILELAWRRPVCERDACLAAVYPTLPVLDFSRDVITPARNLTTYVWPASMGWSDLGTPERLHAWHARAGESAETVTAA